MSVSIADASKIEAAYINAKRILGMTITRDLFTAMHAAQFAAYALTYGETAGDALFSNRAEDAAQVEEMDARTLLEEVYHFEYNWCSNGGTDTLAPKYAAAVEWMKSGLAAAALRDWKGGGSVRIHGVKITLEQIAHTNRQGVEVAARWYIIPGSHSGQGVELSDGTVYPGMVSFSGSVAEVLERAQEIGRHIQADWIKTRGLDTELPPVVTYSAMSTESAAAVLLESFKAPEAAGVAPEAFGEKVAAYIGRLVYAAKRDYALRLLGELSGGEVAAIPEGLKDEVAAEVRAKLARLAKAPRLLN